MSIHKKDELIAAGYTPTGFQINMADSRDVPSHGRIRKIAIALDVMQESLAVFRTSGVAWDVFYAKTGKIDGFKDVALLPLAA